MELRVIHHAEGGLVQEATDAPGAGPFDHIASPLCVDAAEGRATIPIARDRNQVQDGIDAAQSGAQSLRPCHISRSELDARSLVVRQPTKHLRACFLRAYERCDDVTALDERRHHMASHETAGTGDEDPGHGVLSIRDSAG